MKRSGLLIAKHVGGTNHDYSLDPGFAGRLEQSDRAQNVLPGANDSPSDPTPTSTSQVKKGCRMLSANHVGDSGGVVEIHRAPIHFSLETGQERVLPARAGKQQRAMTEVD